MILYWSSYIKHKQNKLIDINTMNKRKIVADISYNSITLEEAKENLNKVIKKQEEVKQREIEIREKEILDLYPVELAYDMD